jgi:uncharacterized membrane protein YbhN (UPF0104 family)
VTNSGAPFSAAFPWLNRSFLIRAAIFLTATGAIVGGLLTWVGAGDVMGLVSRAGTGHLLAVTLLTLTLPAVHALRFRTVLNAIGYPISWKRAFMLTMAVWPISSVTPSKSGDLLKAYYLRGEVPGSVTAGSLLAERALDVAVLGAMSLTGAVVFQKSGLVIFAGGVLVAIIAAFALAPWVRQLPLRESWKMRVDLVLTSTYTLSRNPRLMLATVGLTILNWVTTVVTAALLFDAVGASVPLFYVFAGFPPAVFAGLMPFTLGGMGTRDSVIMLLFDGFATTAQSLAVGILYAFFSRWFLSVLGLPFLHRISRDH